MKQPQKGRQRPCGNRDGFPKSGREQREPGSEPRAAGWTPTGRTGGFFRADAAALVVARKKLQVTAGSPPLCHLQNFSLETASIQ